MNHTFQPSVFHPVWNEISPADMATPSFRFSTPVPVPDVSIPVSRHLVCPICLSVLETPVTTTCGHTFCKCCLDRHLSLSDVSCPLCKGILMTRPTTNIVINNLLEELQKAQRSKTEDLAIVSDEVACDICPEECRRKAVKSCLMCLLSFCPRHLKRHNNKLRLKGHKLVAPVLELDQRACMVHGRPLELYCTREGKCICSLCVEEGAEVVSLEAERGKRQIELENAIKDMQQRTQQREEKEKELEHSAANCLALIERELEEINEAFDAVRAAVARAEEEALGPLREKKKCVESEMEELKEELKREIDMFQKTISDLEKIKDDEDHIHFLQVYPSLPPSESDKDWTDVSLNTDLTFGTMRNIHTTMMAEIETELQKFSLVEIERIKKFEVDVSLDPDTANAQLIVSDDGREVAGSREKSDVPDSPERFDLFGSILGRNKISNGRAFWVVEVGDKQGWDIGVAREEANRKGKISIKPSQGYWSIVHYNGENYAALEDPPTLLCLNDKPRKVGVFVDYQERLVSFYDVEAKSHIYSFTDCAFNNVVRPYFSPHLNDEKNLVICPVNHSDLIVEGEVEQL